MSRAQWGHGFYAGKRLAERGKCSQVKLTPRGSTVDEDESLMRELTEMRGLLEYHHIDHLVKELFYENKNATVVWIYLNVPMHEGFLVGQTLNKYFPEVPYFQMEGADGESYEFWGKVDFSDSLVFDETDNKPTFSKIFARIAGFWHGLRCRGSNVVISDGDGQSPF